MTINRRRVMGLIGGGLAAVGLKAQPAQAAPEAIRCAVLEFRTHNRVQEFPIYNPDHIRFARAFISEFGRDGVLRRHDGEYCLKGERDGRAHPVG